MLETRYRFPPADRANADGLVAQSDHIDAEMAFTAHSQGIFPWYNPGDPILWWSPDPRKRHLIHGLLDGDGAG